MILSLGFDQSDVNSILLFLSDQVLNKSSSVYSGLPRKPSSSMIRKIPPIVNLFDADFLERIEEHWIGETQEEIIAVQSSVPSNKASLKSVSCKLVLNRLTL